MSFTIDGHKAELKSKIESSGKILAEKIKASKPSASASGLQLSEQQRKDLEISAFNVKGGDEKTDVANASTAKSQKQMADAMAAFAANVQNQVATAVNNLEQTIRSLEQKLNGLNSESSAIASNQTSGQSVNPEENMPTDNQGSNNKEINNENNQDNSVNNNNNEDNNTEVKDDTTKETRKEKSPENTQEAKNSPELDKAAQRETQKQFEEAQKKLNQEAERIANAMTSSAA